MAGSTRRPTSWPMGPPFTVTPGARRWLLLLAVVVFLAGGVIAYHNLPQRVRLERWGPLVLLGLVGVPATVALNAARFQISAGILGRRVPRLTAWRVSVGSSAANLLPLPGAALVRIEGLRQLGEGYLPAVASNGVVAGAWVGVTATAAGLLELGAGQGTLGAILTAGGGAALLAAALLLRSRVGAGRRWALACRILAIEAAVLAVAAGRLYLVLQALGVATALHQAVVLTLAGVAASAVGLFPGGMGLREAMAAGLAPLVAISPAVGYLAAAIDRLVGLTVLVPLTLLLLIDRRRRPDGRDGPAAGGEDPARRTS